MANTKTFSIRLKPEIKKRLAKLAKASGRSSNFLVSDAVESYVSDQERLLAEIRQAERQIKSGHYIRREELCRLLPRSKSSGRLWRVSGFGRFAHTLPGTIRSPQSDWPRAWWQWW